MIDNMYIILKMANLGNLTWNHSVSYDQYFLPFNQMCLPISSENDH